MGPGLDPCAGERMPRQRRRVTGRASTSGRTRHADAPRRSPRRSVASCGWSTSPRPTPATPDSSKPTTSACDSPTAAATSTCTGVPQRWLRDLLWDHLADTAAVTAAARAAAGRRRDPQRGSRARRLPGNRRTRRRARPAGCWTAGTCTGSSPTSATGNATACRRSAAAADGNASTSPTVTRSHRVQRTSASMLRDALDTGTADRIGLAREFIVACPRGGTQPPTVPRPFPDEVARALADETTCQPRRHLRPATTAACATSGRPSSSPAAAPAKCSSCALDCLGRYGGLPMLWHDQTKVGNYDAAIRIPERRSRAASPSASARPWTASPPTTAAGPPTRARTDGAVPVAPTATPTARVPLATSGSTAGSGSGSTSSTSAQLRAAPGPPHPGHQAAARTAPACTHIRRYLGPGLRPDGRALRQCRHSDIEDVLQHVWVAGPGAANPGELLAGETTR